MPLGYRADWDLACNYKMDYICYNHFISKNVSFFYCRYVKSWWQMSFFRNTCPSWFENFSLHSWSFHLLKVKLYKWKSNLSLGPNNGVESKLFDLILCFLLIFSFFIGPKDTLQSLTGKLQGRITNTGRSL